MNRFFKILVIGLLVLTGVFFINGCSNLETSTNSKVIPVYTYKVVNTYPHDRSAFTEGLVFEDIGFVYDKYSFKLLQEFNYPDEGWGITHDGNHLIMSDGTEILHFLNPETFEEVNQIEVYANNIPVTRINELEYIQGEIYANIWQTERIARINPLTGQVIGWIDLEGILSPEDHRETVDVINGIAYDAKNNRLFVTGKFWPKLFEIELIGQGTAESK
jgi:glutamine cyclotransferase